jgi:ABC-type branched-subunit amino acid transport system ATPase component/branched-subunit amino acid ABC-type transport system permease component
VTQVLLFALVGLGSGAVYAALGLSLVVTYKGTGVINVAAGAMAMWSAYVFDELRSSGDLVLPLVLVPHRFDLSDGEPLASAFALSLVSSALLAVLVHLLVFRPLRKAPTLAKVVASVGLLLAVQALVVINFGSTPRAVPPILPVDSFTVAGQLVPADRVYLAALAMCAGFALWAYFRYTRIGVATRAAAENEQATALARWNPQLLGITTWVIATAVGGLIAILASPALGLNPFGYTLLVVPALACALVGRLTRLGPVIAAGLVLGALQSEVTYATTQAWWPAWAANGFGDALPFLVIVAVLFAVGRSLPTRASQGADPLPAVAMKPVRPIAALIATALGAVAVLATDGTLRFGVITTMIMAIVALSLVVLTGLVGQISLAQAALAGSAGFALSKLTTGWGLPFPIATILAALTATALGIIVGLPALRIRGAQPAVVTLALAVGLERFLFRNPAFTPSDGNRIPALTLFGWDLGIRGPGTVARWQFGIVVLAILLVLGLAVKNLTASATGRRFLAVRDNERAAASIGIDVAATKLAAFALASFIAGVGGALIGYSRGQLSADSFTALVGIGLLAYAYLGGITSVSGAIIAGALAPLGVGYVVLDGLFANLSDWYLLISGALLIATAIFNPVGIAGALRRPTRTPTAPQGVPAAAPRTVVAPGQELLCTNGLSVSYGGVHAVDDVSLTVHTGQIVGLIGPNGAGKTSFLDALTGITAHAGTVHFGGVGLDGMGPHKRYRLGLARTWQSGELFEDLTVAQNIAVAAQTGTFLATLADLVHPSRTTQPSGVAWALELLELQQFAHHKPADLPLGVRKLVGVARALAAQPALVLLDEPAAGLSTTETAQLATQLRKIVAHGTAILLIDHDMSLVMDVCDHLYVLDFGQLIAQGSPADVRNDPHVIGAYLGTEVPA